MDIRDYAHEGRWWKRVTGFTAISTDNHYDGNENVAVRAGERVPVRFEVCNVCDGRGNYVNPAIDSHGIGAEEMYELGEEFFNDYRSGVYDIRCELCEGRATIPVPTNEIHAAALKISAEDHYRANAEYESERRMGA